MSCHPARSNRTPRSAPMARPRCTRVRRAAQHTTTGSHSSPVRPDTGTVAIAPYSTSTQTAAATPATLGSPRSTSTPITRPTATVRICPGRHPASEPPRSRGPKR